MSDARQRGDFYEREICSYGPQQGRPKDRLSASITVIWPSTGTPVYYGNKPHYKSDILIKAVLSNIDRQ